MFYKKYIVIAKIDCTYVDLYSVANLICPSYYFSIIFTLPLVCMLIASC